MVVLAKQHLLLPPPSNSAPRLLPPGARYEERRQHPVCKPDHALLLGPQTHRSPVEAQAIPAQHRSGKTLAAIVTATMAAVQSAAMGVAYGVLKKAGESGSDLLLYSGLIGFIAASLAGSAVLVLAGCRLMRTPVVAAEDGYGMVNLDSRPYSLDRLT